MVVQWDRRGAGKSFSAGEPEQMRVSQEVADVIALIQSLQLRFGQQRVILVGHSYGSYLGVAVVRQRPDLVRAYVGVGQIACTNVEEVAIQDAWLRSQASAAGDQKTIFAIDSGLPWDRESALFQYGGEVSTMKSFLSLVMIGLRAPEYSFSDAMNVKRGVDFTHAHLIDDGPGEPLYTTASRLDVPVYFFTGRRDYTAPFECTQRYFQALQAPTKQFVWFVKVPILRSSRNRSAFAMN